MLVPRPAVEWLHASHMQAAFEAVGPRTQKDHVDLATAGCVTGLWMRCHWSQSTRSLQGEISRL